jgi:hypothetical protein
MTSSGDAWRVAHQIVYLHLLEGPPDREDLEQLRAECVLDPTLTSLIKLTQRVAEGLSITRGDRQFVVAQLQPAVADDPDERARMISTLDAAVV